MRDVQRGGVGDASFITIGKKSEQFVRRQGWNLTASFTNLSVAPTIAELRPVARLTITAFTDHAVDEVRIAFTDFVSSLRQQPHVRTLLPLQRIAGVGEAGIHDDGRRGGVHPLPQAGVTPAPTGGSATEFLFEPSPDAVLAQMLPRLVDLQVYQCYLETGASEHSARMLAMRNASDSAGEMIDDLTLTFNQARQAMITREIAEIAAGRAAIAA
jgi:F-type H+-transporting ATPase subunit gamma